MSTDKEAASNVEHQVLENKASTASGSAASRPHTQPEKIDSLVSIFVADHKDMMLLGYYTALLKLYDGSNDENDPTICTMSEEIVDWLGFAVMLVVYIVRHFFLETKGAQRLLWAKLVRLFLFGAFALCLHSQPISCSLPRSDLIVPNGTVTAQASTSGHLHTLSFVQGAIVLTLALVASETCRRQLMAPDSSDQADGRHRGTEMKELTSSQPA